METEIRQIHNFHEGDKFHEHYRLLEHVGSVHWYHECGDALGGELYH